MSAGIHALDFKMSKRAIRCPAPYLVAQRVVGQFENLAHAVSLHFMHYNFCRVHQSLKGQTPAMAAGIADHPLSLTQLVEVLEEWEWRAKAA